MIYFCISTVKSADAQRLARQLVEERLAACVNVLPGAQSIYRWKGEICEDEESVLYIKTSPNSVGTFEERFRELHPYDCPELLILPVEEGLKEYFYWVEESTLPNRSGEHSLQSDSEREGDAS
ncbi:MAG: divalent-cation tolerance protein CutA [Planctomycetota bacterium]